jgi:hypothetical protein
LKPTHIPVIGFMIVSQEMKQPMNQQPADFGFESGSELRRLLLSDLRRDDYLPQEGPSVGSLSGIPEAQYIRGVILFPILAIDLAHFARSHKNHLDRRRPLSQNLQDALTQQGYGFRSYFKPPLPV